MNTPPPLPLSNNDKLLAVLCHLSALLGVGLILPLVIWLVKKDDSPVVAEHAREVLNFQLSVLIYSLCSAVLVFVVIGVFMLIAIGIGSLVFAIVAAVKASEGKLYRYPACLRMVG
ncbi:MAG: DUF4870 domain-containing protein [Opitutaceae bacterium]|jgi:uncharacterized Tic20 family protein|nr:DUF4870 domain-containing protein [Opitutaceae bacterium]